MDQINKILLNQVIYDMQQGHLRRCLNLGFTMDELREIEQLKAKDLHYIAISHVSFADFMINHQVLKSLLEQAAEQKRIDQLIERAVLLGASVEMLMHYFGLNVHEISQRKKIAKIASQADLKKWQLMQLPIIPNNWKMIVKPQTKKQFQVIQKLLKKVKHVIIATDANREGEMIAREILDYCKWQGKIERLWLSALDEASIKKALMSLKSNEETYPLYLAALDRSRADWLVGMNFTRLFTLLSQNQGYSGVLSVGRVQTPTLKLVFDRDNEIKQFIAKPYWLLNVQLMSSKGEPFVARWISPDDVQDESGRCIDQAAAMRAKVAIELAKHATVISVETKRSKESAPLPFSLSALQQACSRKWGFGAQQVLDIAQSLYETHKVTTYPRTDCGYLPESMFQESPPILQNVLRCFPPFQNVKNALNLHFRSRVWNDKKITAHHGIIPTIKLADLSKMTDSEQKVYKLICQHYLAQFLPISEYDKTTLILKTANESLESSGKVDIVTCWKTLFQSEKNSDLTENNEKLPQLTQHEICSLKIYIIKELKTMPPVLSKRTH